MAMVMVIAIALYQVAEHFGEKLAKEEENGRHSNSG